MIPITKENVEDALERALTTDEAATWVFKAKKAARLVEGYLGVEYDASTIPDVVIEVTAGVVARAYAAASSDVPEFVNTATEGMGAFSVSRTFNSDATSGSLWLAKADKIKLRMIYSGVRSVRMRSDRGYC